jgi:hypothetical protein
MSTSKNIQRLIPCLSLAIALPAIGATTVSADLLVAGTNNTLIAMHTPWAGAAPVVSTTNSGMFAAGFYNTIHGVGSGSVGYSNTVWMKNAMALGKYNEVGVEYAARDGIESSVAIGEYNRIESPNTLVVGYRNSTSYDPIPDIDEGGRQCLIVGSWNNSSGHDSIIAGQNNSISSISAEFLWPATSSGVIGTGLISKYNNCLIVGKNNSGAYIPDGQSPPLFVVGNGTSASSRADAFVVKANGDVIITKVQGDISMGIYGD